ncbi:hypothetical protein MSAN_02083600 [Mycena sanguinolenta]|uniref:F-box domain-containing protein n=1 Tax=Mycena sanguinolenta TaxID=230812 RepID=A0A8H6XH75_9AGAR|nr:hypothetical protein MSAN_02083600 [Mycena sanguinolenta]
MLSNLPQELIEFILVELDTDSLRACSLVSSPLFPPSQRLIFRSLVVSYADIPKAQSLFASADHILHYCTGIFPPLIPSSRVFLTIKGRTVEWKDMTLPLHSALHALLDSAAVYSLNLAGIFDVPPSFILLALSSFRRLGLYSITLDASEPDILERPGTLRTEQLTIRAPYEDSMKRIADVLLQDKSMPGYLDNIKQLTVGMHRAVKPESLRLIGAAANNLRCLHLRCGVFRTHIDLPHLPVLKVIELKLYLGFSVGLPQNLYTTIAAFPETVPAIETLRLTFYGALPGREDLVNDPAGCFPLFNDACAYRGRLPCLRRVHCNGWWDPANTTREKAEWADFSVYVESKFPGLRGTRILMIAAAREDQTTFD